MSISKLYSNLHVDYIQKISASTNDLSFFHTEHLRLNGIYWGLTSLSLLNKIEALDKNEMIKFVKSCWNEQVGAFSAFPNHDPNLHSTLSAIQILSLLSSMDSLNIDAIVNYILSLQDSKIGSFSGDLEGSEHDSRFSYCAISALSLIGKLSALNKPLTISFIKSCKNFDGGFGMTTGAESHAAYVWTCLGALAILDSLEIVDQDVLCWWLCERQLPCGGLNGRPEKLEDVCYSWWALASLAILGRSHWIDATKLSEFILSAQDDIGGGIADRPEDQVDVWHTIFGLAGLSLLGYQGLEAVDPIYCMPKSFTKSLKSN